ncbi:MAG: hypothetical protein H0X25_21490 [Acidobacteriales bacterium]|nr:hypothetical protein [Terriglobales bacterium]
MPDSAGIAILGFHTASSPKIQPLGCERLRSPGGVSIKHSWPCLLAYLSGKVDQELLLRNEYLVAENRILRNQVKGRLLLSEGEKATLAEIAHRSWGRGRPGTRKTRSRPRVPVLVRGFRWVAGSSLP